MKSLASGILSPVSVIAFSPDGATLATGGNWGTVGLWNSKTGAGLGQAKKLSGSVCGLVFVEKGQTLLAGSNGGLYRIEVSTGRLSKTRIGPTKLNGFAVGPSEKQLLSRVDNQAQLWNLDTGQPMGELTPDEGSFLDAVFSPDGKTVLTGGTDGAAKLWSAETGELISELSGCLGSTGNRIFDPAS